LLYVVPAYSSGFLIAFMVILMTNVALAQDWNMFSGNSGYPFLGAAAFFGIGEYVTAYSTRVVPYYLAVPLGGLLSGALGLLLGLAILRLRGTYFAILTFVLSEVLKWGFVSYEVANFHSVGRILETQNSVTVYIFVLTITLIALYVSYRIKNSKIGLGLFAIRADEDVAEVSGVDTRLYKVLVFALSASLMGLVGAAAVGRTGYVDPFSAFNPTISFQALVMCSLGGVGTIIGPILGAAVMTVLAEFLLGTYPLLYNLILGVVIVVVVVLMPGGLLRTFGKAIKLSKSQ
jgi:branched-chain amino acid transport system permease protein